MKFGVGIFRVRTYFWPNLNPPLEHLTKVVLKCFVNTIYFAYSSWVRELSGQPWPRINVRWILSELIRACQGCPKFYVFALRVLARFNPELAGVS